MERKISMVDRNKPGRPWYREPMMWLVLGGPALVVVASLSTYAIAVHKSDPVIERDAVTEAERVGGTDARAARKPAACAQGAQPYRLAYGPGRQIRVDRWPAGCRHPASVASRWIDQPAQRFGVLDLDVALLDLDDAFVDELREGAADGLSFMPR